MNTTKWEHLKNSVVSMQREAEALEEQTKRAKQNILDALGDLSKYHDWQLITIHAIVEDGYISSLIEKEIDRRRSIT